MRTDRKANQLQNKRAAKDGVMKLAALAAAAGIALSLAPAAFAEKNDVCIAYFTWWENARVPADVSAAANPDVVSGASLQSPGHVGRMAQRIAQKLGVKAFPIRAAKPYPYDFDELLPIARAENDKNARPALDAASAAYRLGSCRTLYLGFPNWDYDMPSVVKTFVESIGRDGWSGVTIYPFASTGSGGWANSLETLRQLAPGAQLGEPLALRRSAIKGSDQEIDAWLEKAVKP